MITKEQAFEALNRVQNGTSDGWQSFDVVRRFIEQSKPGVSEDEWVNKMINALEDNGIDTSRWDGDNDPVEIIANGVRHAIDDAVEQSQSVPKKISRYPGHIPPEDGEAGAYYVEGWNDCVDEMLAAAPKPGADDE